MPDQTASAVLVALKQEAALGEELADVNGAKLMRLIDSPGLRLNRNPIESQERRADQLRHMGRLAGHQVEGSFNCEWSVGGIIDDLLAAICRGNYAPAVAEANVAGVTIAVDGGANTFARAAGSWVTDGYRIGHVISVKTNRLIVVGFSNNNKTMKAVGQLLPAAAAAAVSTGRLKRVVTPTDTAGGPAVLIPRSYNVEQYDKDIDASELFLGNRVSEVGIALRPNAIAEISFSFFGLTRKVIAPADAPFFNAPTKTNTTPLVADDASIFYKGSKITTLSGMNLTLAIDTSTQPTIGSVIPSDVYSNRLNVSGDVMAIRQDLAALADFDAETEFDIGVMLLEPGSKPQNCASIYIPRVKIAGIEAPVIGGDGAKIETRELMFGPNTGKADKTAGIAYFSSSA